MTGEDTLSITALGSATAPEFSWYSEILRKLKVETTRSSAALVVVVVPLKYQLEPDYPHIPQESLFSICEELGVPYIDPLDDFRQRRSEELYINDNDRFDDIWHFSQQGHELLAEVLTPFVQETLRDISETRQ